LVILNQSPKMSDVCTSIRISALTRFARKAA
jgi:hypothetical protein